MSARGEARAGAQQHGKPRARHPRRALEIQNPERRAQIPMRLRREVHHWRRAPSPHFRHCPRRTSPPARCRAAGSAARAAAHRAAARCRPTPLPARESAPPAPCSPRRFRSHRGLPASPAPRTPPLRSAARFRFSTSGISRRRSASSPASAARSADGSIPRARSRASTSGRRSRTRAGSITSLVLAGRGRRSGSGGLLGGGRLVRRRRRSVLRSLRLAFTLGVGPGVGLRVGLCFRTRLRRRRRTLQTSWRSPWRTSRTP